MYSPKLFSHLAIISANVILGINVPFTKALLESWLSPFGYILSRSVSAAVIFGIIGIVFVHEKIKPKDLAIIALGGLMGFIISQYLTALSLQYTTPIRFALIVALSPIIVMLEAAVFIHEKIKLYKVIGVCFSILGAAVLVLNAHQDTGNINEVYGIILALISISAYGLYVIIMRDISQKYRPLTQMKWLFLFTTVMALPLNQGSFFSQPIFTGAPWYVYAEFYFLIVFATILSYLLIPYGMHRISATNASVYMNFQPVVAAIVSIIMGQDVFTWDKPLAAVLVITGAMIVSLGGKIKIGNKKPCLNLKAQI